MPKTVVGLFQNERDARAGVREIEGLGLDRNHWSYIDREFNQLADRLTELGIPQHDAILYADGIKSGGVVVLLQALPDDIADQTAAVLHRFNLVDVDEGRDEAAAPSTTVPSGVYAGSATIVPIEGAELGPGDTESTYPGDLAPDDQQHPPRANY